MLAWNGSSPTGKCLNITVNTSDYITTCVNPTNSSVLFDGKIPKINTRDSSWASELLILQKSYNMSSFYLSFHFDYFSLYSGIKQIEVIVMHCPEWNIAAQTIDFYGSGFAKPLQEPFVIVYNTIPRVPCGSLLKICIPVNFDREDSQYLALNFSVNPSWVHIAEVTFFNASSSCPVFTIIERNENEGTNFLHFYKESSLVVVIESGVIFLLVVGIVLKKVMPKRARKSEDNYVTQKEEMKCL